jgi:predicted secreted protein
MKKILLHALLLMCVSMNAEAQKTVAADVKFSGRDTSLVIGKNETFLVELWVPNRKGYEWAIAKASANCKFLRSQIGEAATLPGQPEQQLWFFKTTQKGDDSIRFVYRRPSDADIVSEKVLRVTVQ